LDNAEMSTGNIPRATILGTGHAAPEAVVTNEDLVSRGVDTTDAWIQERLGIRERRHAHPDEQTSDLCVAAAQAALKEAGLAPEDLSVIMVALGNGDIGSPATACIVQEKLGAKGAWAYDLRAACAGFLVGLKTAAALAAAEGGYALVIGADVASRTKINWKDRTLPAIFGDGAGAAIVGPSPDPERGIVASTIHSDGALAGIVGVRAGGSVMPLDQAVVEAGHHLVHMEGRKVWDHAVKVMPEVIHEAIEKAGLNVDDVDFIVTHQANKRLLEEILKRAKIPVEKTHTTVEHYGNTLAASLAMTLDEAVGLGKIQKGMTVVLAAVGAGMTWGAMVVRW
jgi:3-oxoacyl-[acyl-carrier-protein] synthase-3